MPDTFLAPPTAGSAALREVFRPVFDRIAKDGADRENSRALVHDQVRWLVDAGFATLRIPVALGGLGASLRQTFELLADLGAADPNVAHIFRNHLAFVEDRLAAGDAHWIPRFLAGEFVGGGWTEANNGTLDNLKTHLRQHGDHWEVTGAKFYATGSLYADWLDVLGQGPDGTPITAVVRVDQPGVTLVDDWTGFGQRVTGSGSANYNAARIENEDVIAYADRAPYLGHFYQEAMLSALAGIAAAIHRDGVDALRARQRTYRHAVTATITDDPQLLQVVGRLSALAYGARAALAESASTLDDVVAAYLAGEPLPLVESNVAIAQAQIVVIDQTLEAATLVFDALGASGVSEKLRLDRHWRNARTLASHNPRVYKERLLGDWSVNGRNPLQALAGTATHDANQA